MIKTRTTMLLSFSVLLAFGAAWIANSWVQQRTEQKPEINTVSVVVASTDIPYGYKVENINLKYVRIAEDLAPPGAVVSMDEIAGMVSQENILAGDILRPERFSQHLEGSTLAAVISPDKRAVTVRVNDVVGVAGFLLPGNEVDVLATKKEKKKFVTETVLKKIKVLAVDQTKSTKKNEPVIVRAVTLETTPAQAETLVKAREEGSIQLTLRNPLEELAPTAPAKKAAPVRHNPYRTAYVTVIRGTSSELKKVTYKK